MSGFAFTDIGATVVGSTNATRDRATTNKASILAAFDKSRVTPEIMDEAVKTGVDGADIMKAAMEQNPLTEIAYRIRSAQIADEAGEPLAYKHIQLAHAEELTSDLMESAAYVQELHREEWQAAADNNSTPEL